MSKKVFAILAVIGMLALAATPAFAVDGRNALKASQKIEATGVMTDGAGNTMDYSTYVYGVSIYADDASSFVGVYDCDTTAELIAATIYPKVEIGEATQYDTEIIWFPSPIYFDDGVSVIMSTGVALVYYGPPGL